MSPSDLAETLGRLRNWVEAEEFRGYDPYDTLTGSIDFCRFGKWAPVIAIQIQKRNPLNLRPVLGIEKAHNPKAMGLFLEAYSLMYASEGDEAARTTADSLFEWLLENRSEGYSGACWGYNFDWASPAKYLPAHTPSAVVTGFVARGIFEYHRATGEERAVEVLRSACDFILNDLPRTETGDGCCFSYTPVVIDCCYNASLLAAELLARAYALTGEEGLLSLVTPAVDFVIGHQKLDGRWHYSIDPDSGAERAQIDFHQGFLLDSLTACIQFGSLADPRYANAVRNGAEFYRTKQFADNGRAYWRLPKEWPADIHHQAQGIISFTKLAEIDLQYLETAESIAQWTIENMLDPRGYFYYRKGRVATNRIPYIRWGQAWMMVALCQISVANRAGSARVTEITSSALERISHV